MTSAKNVQLRNAQPSDMEGVLKLIKELAIYENAENEVTNTVDNLIADGFGDKNAFKCVVAELNNQIIGFALYYYSYSTWKGKCLYLEDFLITQKFRQKGIGKLLFDKIHTIAKTEKVKRFEWQVLDWNKPAINFYKKEKAIFDSEWINCKIVFGK